MDRITRGEEVIMRYPKIDTQKLKAQINPSDFYMREQDLNRFEHKSGQWALAGLCPFHNDSSAGSFKVNIENGAFKCFSCGVKGGDIIAFTQKKYDLPFRETLLKLAKEWRAS